MYLRAGVVSLGLLIASRLLGLLRESVQAAALGSTGLADAVILMFTLPDLLVGVLFSGALAYVLLPDWAERDGAGLDASQRRVARRLAGLGLALALLLWLGRDALARALAPGLQGELVAMGGAALGWSAAVLPFAMLAALWVTRLQHERDFVGMYSANLVVNLVLVFALVAVPLHGEHVVGALGAFLLLAMLARLGWLGWRLPRAAPRDPQGAVPALPAAPLWLWAALSSGLLLLLPLIGRSLASRAGEGALANFNYAWKLVELPLVLAVQLVASLAFPAIARSAAGSAARERAVGLALALAWGLACAAIAVVGGFSRQLADLLFGWGRMDAAHLETIARWSAIGVWSLLPQALMAVLLTVMAAARRMRHAVACYAAGVLALLLAAAGGLAGGAAVMWALDLLLGAIALAMLFGERRQLSVPWAALAAPLLVCAALAACRPWFAGLGLAGAAFAAAAAAAAVLASAFGASPLLRAALRRAPAPAGGQ